jgi:transposase
VSVVRKPKRFLTGEQKYDLWVRILTGQVTQSDAAAEAGVDRTTIATLRKTARDGAIAALQASRPGKRKVSAEEASELAKLRAEVDRLGSVVIDQAVELAVLRGKSSWG